MQQDRDYHLIGELPSNAGIFGQILLALGVTIGCALIVTEYKPALPVTASLSLAGVCSATFGVTKLLQEIMLSLRVGSYKSWAPAPPPKQIREVSFIRTNAATNKEYTIEPQTDTLDITSNGVNLYDLSLFVMIAPSFSFGQRRWTLNGPKMPSTSKKMTKAQHKAIIAELTEKLAHNGLFVPSSGTSSACFTAPSETVINMLGLGRYVDKLQQDGHL